MGRNYFQKGIIQPILLLAVLGVILFLATLYFAPFKTNLLSNLNPKSDSLAANGFIDTFDGAPGTPQPFLQDPDSDRWDVAVQYRDNSTWQTLEPFEAHHGPDCGAPIDALGKMVTHHDDGSYLNAVFKCKDHLMTSIKASGYGVIYLTPDQILDFSNGEVVVKVDVSTLRTSGRDWWDLWVTPYNENLQLPFDEGEVDLNGVPQDSIHISNDGNANGSGTGFHPVIYKNFQPTTDFQPFSSDYNWFTGYEQFMATSPQQRTTFELHISKTHLKFGIPAGQVDAAGKPVNNGQAFWWIDKDITPLTWNQGIIQFGHHSYNPQKDCPPDPTLKTCYPDTWHWDAVSISNSTPVTIIKASKRMVDGASGNDTVEFNSPAPANANLRFAGIGSIQLSFDGKKTWQAVPKQSSSGNKGVSAYHPEHMSSYWVPIPQGATQVSVRFAPDSWYTGPYQAKDFAIWSTAANESSSSSPISGPVNPSASPVKPGDIDGNGKVDIFDFNILLTNFGQAKMGLAGDLDNNGQVDIFDFNTLLTNFGR